MIYCFCIYDEFDLFVYIVYYKCMDIALDNTILKEIQRACETHEKVVALYFFGSRAHGDAGPMSDYDFAVYIDSRDKKEIFDVVLTLRDTFCRILKTDAVDLSALNLIEKPELKYNIIAHGILVFEREPFRVIMEPRILNEYFDFRTTLRKYGLTRA